MPCARAMWGFAPVARSELPFSVPKNQYRMAMTAARRDGREDYSSKPRTAPSAAMTDILNG